MVSQAPQSLSRVFHALADPTRREMLGLLATRGECTAGQLGNPFDIAQPTASKHIRVLEEAGLVARRVVGRTRRFRLEQGPIDEIQDWLTTHRAFWQASLESLHEYLEETRDNGGNPV